MTPPVPTVLICPGQGAQRAGGVTDLADSFEQLSEAGRDAFQLAASITGCDLWQLGLSEDAADEAALRRPSLLQPFLVAWAAAEFARAAEQIGPLGFVTGHSSGMNSAMAISGALELETALQFAHECGRSMDRDCDERPGGLLALVGAGRETAIAVAERSGAALANHNAPDQTVLGGSFASLDAAAELTAAYDCQPVELRVAGAFHTPSFAQSDRANRALIDALPIREPFTPIIGNHTGQFISTAEQLRDELRDQYVRPVEWQSVLHTLHSCGVRRFISLGPGNVMAGLVRRFGRSLPDPIRIQRISQFKSPGGAQHEPL